MWNASGSGDSVLLYKTLHFSVKGVVTPCLSSGIPWWVGGRTHVSHGCPPTPACASFQVHEQTCDEWPRALRSYDHHECRYFSLLPERRMVQISILPSIFFLLLIWHDLCSGELLRRHSASFVPVKCMQKPQKPQILYSKNLRPRLNPEPDVCN